MRSDYGAVFSLTWFHRKFFLSLNYLAYGLITNINLLLLIRNLLELGQLNRRISLGALFSRLNYRHRMPHRPPTCIGLTAFQAANRKLRDLVRHTFSVRSLYRNFLSVDEQFIVR
jgi:hypothetical protein